MVNLTRLSIILILKYILLKLLLIYFFENYTYTFSKNAHIHKHFPNLLSKNFYIKNQEFLKQLALFKHFYFSGTEITGLAHQLGYEREVIRIWFCNKRQALKNTVRMMSKGMV